MISFRESVDKLFAETREHQQMFIDDILNHFRDEGWWVSDEYNDMRSPGGFEVGIWLYQDSFTVKFEDVTEHRLSPWEVDEEDPDYEDVRYREWSEYTRTFTIQDGFDAVVNYITEMEKSLRDFTKRTGYEKRATGFVAPWWRWSK